MIAAIYNMILDAGFWILDEIRNFFTFLIFRKGPYNKLIIFPGTVNGKVFIPAEDGSFDQHPVSSIASPQAVNLTNAHKLVGFRHSFARSRPMATMRALVKAKSKPGLWLEEVPVPKIGTNDVLIKTHKTAICGTDVHIYNWDKWARKTIPIPTI